jgi:glutamyl-tRNA synthetase
LGHARTFWTAQARARQRDGVLILRNEDLDPERSKSQFLHDLIEDLQWFGFRWQEGPDCGGPFTPYSQSQRRRFYVEAWDTLWRQGLVYPCQCSRRDVQNASQAPHGADDEPMYPGTCRDNAGLRSLSENWMPSLTARRADQLREMPVRLNWRFRVPDGETIEFKDGRLGPQYFTAGQDFGDFVLWRHDDVPSYQLAVTVDDALMKMTEVVRGADLLVSTARQLLLYRALGYAPPEFFHCELMTDQQGVRLAKRHDSFSLRSLRAAGQTPEELRRNW